MSRCPAFTKEGKGPQCTRMLKEGNSYCFQHLKCQTPDDTSPKIVKSKISKKLKSKKSTIKEDEPYSPVPSGILPDYMPKDIVGMIGQYIKSPGEEALDILNMLGHHYHTYLGFHPESQDEPHILIEMEDVEDNDMIHQYYQNLMDLSDDGNVWIERKSYKLDYEGFIKECSDKYCKIYLDINKVKEWADTPIIGKDLITIMYQKNDWFGNPRIWWNSPSKWFKNLKPRIKPNILLPLNSRPYIHVIEPFMRVEIDAIEKGSPITIDDILFATRALALDETRTYDGFKILNETLRTLTLEPEMDNWST